jgi:hypothetical protein
LVIEIIENYIERQIIRNNIYNEIESSSGNSNINELMKKHQKERDEIEAYVRDSIIPLIESNKAEDVKNKINDIEKDEKQKFNLLKEILTIKDNKEKLKHEKEYDKLSLEIESLLEDLNFS